jgi:hypothetical protein
MNKRTKRLIGIGIGVGVASAAIGYFTSAARTGRQPGQNKILDFNDVLLKLNPIAWLMESFASMGAPTTPAINVTPPASSSTPIFLPAAQNVTDQASGTTTTFGP